MKLFTWHSIWNLFFYNSRLSRFKGPGLVKFVLMLNTVRIIMTDCERIFLFITYKTSYGILVQQPLQKGIVSVFYEQPEKASIVLFPLLCFNGSLVFKALNGPAADFKYIFQR